MGFERAPSRVAVRKPAAPIYPSTSGGTATRNTVLAVAVSRRPAPRPGPVAPPQALTAELKETIDQTLALVDLDKPKAEPFIDLKATAGGLASVLVPRPRPASLVASAIPAKREEPARMAQEEIVTRLSTSGGRHWGITVGRFGSRHQAERVLLQTALLELGTLDEALRKVVESSSGYDANFVGLSSDQAELACRRLTARNVDCATFGPAG